MENKLTIKEDQFNIEIHGWDDFTLGFLKSYSDWKCNGQQVPVAPPVDVSVTIEKQPESINHKEFVKPLFPEKQPLAKASKYGNTPIHSPILEHILKSLPDKFTKKNVYESIYDFYNKSGRGIKLVTAVVYSGSYCNYMLDKRIVAETNEGFVRVKKNQNLKVKS